MGTLDFTYKEWAGLTKLLNKSLISQPVNKYRPTNSQRIKNKIKNKRSGR